MGFQPVFDALRQDPSGGAKMAHFAPNSGRFAASGRKIAGADIQNGLWAHLIITIPAANAGKQRKGM